MPRAGRYLCARQGCLRAPPPLPCGPPAPTDELAGSEPPRPHHHILSAAEEQRGSAAVTWFPGEDEPRWLVLHDPAAPPPLLTPHSPTVVSVTIATQPNTPEEHHCNPAPQPQPVAPSRSWQLQPAAPSVVPFLEFTQLVLPTGTSALTVFREAPGVPPLHRSVLVWAPTPCLFITCDTEGHGRYRTKISNVLLPWNR